MPHPTPRLASLALAAFVAVGAAGVAPATAAASDLSVEQAEAHMANLLNAERANAGLGPVIVDGRLTLLARQRSQDMAAKRYFSHTQPDGRNVFDLIAAAGIAWSGAGEIIAWNNWSTLGDSALVARDGWMASPGHRAVVMSAAYNYFGIGLAIDPADGRKLWTGVFMTAPAAQAAQPAQPAPAAAAPAGYRVETVRWTARALRIFQVQVRTDGGAWRWVARSTRATSRTIRVWTGHTYDVRVRPCTSGGTCRGWRITTLHG